MAAGGRNMIFAENALNPKERTLGTTTASDNKRTVQLTLHRPFGGMHRAIHAGTARAHTFPTLYWWDHHLVGLVAPGCTGKVFCA